MSQGSRSTFGKYTLLRKLASGGMGEVFLAKQRGPSGFEKLLVIKRILSHHLDKRDYLDMFFSEAKLVARLNHNNIIQIHEMGEIDGDYYIAMEYVRGKSLRDIIDELRAEGRMLPLPHVIDLAIKLCEGLGYAHQARDIRGRPMNIVHRDINPHNVLISYNGDLKLIDFGIAKSEMTSVHTATGTIKGKFVYMSPEQSAADPIDRRSDIFSLGIVLYEMTVLENPFVRQNVVLSLEAIQRHAIPPPSAKRPDAGPMDAILLRALEKKSEERYQSATEMRDDLRNLFRNGHVTPSEEDISVFLHDLFRADIEEEDRLLAEADRATSPPLAIQEVDTRAAFQAPPAPADLDLSDLNKSGLIGAAHSSDAEGANPVARARDFHDEEPTLSGNPKLLEKMSREVSSRAVASPLVTTADEDEARPKGQVMTLIPPDEVVPGTGEEFLPEIPTRSDRIPRSNSGSSAGPLALANNKDAMRMTPSVPPAAPARTPMPHAAAYEEPKNGASGESKNDATLRMRHPDHRDKDEDVLAQIARTHSDEARPGAPNTVVPPFRSLLAEEPGGAGRAGPRWKSLGLAMAGVLVFAATAVAGFVATRAVTRPPGALRAQTVEQTKKVEDESAQAVDKTPLSGQTQAAKSATASVHAEAVHLPERTVEPKNVAAATEERPEKKLSPREEKKRKNEEDRQKALAAKEERKRKLEEERKKKEEEKKKRDEEKKEAERQRKDEEAAARKALADAKREEKAKRAAAAAAKKNEAADDGLPEGDAPRRRPKASQTASQEESSASADEGSKRKVVVPQEEKPAEEPPRRKVVAPQEDKPAEEPPKRRVVVAPDGQPASNDDGAAAAKKKVAPAESSTPQTAGGEGGGQHSGTLTLSTSLEVSVEVDGKPAGTSPAVISVKKGSGKIKLFGSNVDYQVTLNYKVEDEGVSVKLDANPWAIAKHNGISLGKTPQNVKAEPKHRFSLLRPGQHAPLVISLLWNNKSE